MDLETVHPRTVLVASSPAATANGPGRPRRPQAVVAAVLEEARWAITATTVLRFGAGAILAAGSTVVSPSMLLGVLAWTCVSVSTYVLNGCTDVEGDRVNGSARPIASGRLPVETAWTAVVATGAAALSIGATISPLFFAHVCFALALGIWYSVGERALKHRTHTAALGLGLGAVLTMHAGLVAAGGSLTVGYAFVLGATVIWITGAAVAKDLSDLEGDRAAGRHTYAARHGARAAQAVSVLCLVLGCAALGVGAAVDTRMEVVALTSTVALAIALCALYLVRSVSRNGRQHLSSSLGLGYACNVASLLT